MGLDRRKAQLAQTRQPAVVELPAAPAEQQPEQRQKAGAVADVEQFQNVPRVETVDPLTERPRLLAFGQQRCRQPAVQEPPVEVPHAERFRAFLPQHRAEVNHGLAPGQRVAELAGGGQRRRPGGQHLETRIYVRSDLQEAAGVRQPVDLVEHDGRPGLPAFEEELRIVQGPRAVEGRSQFRKTASGSIRARVVLPTRRTPDSQTTGRRVHARCRRSSQSGLLFISVFYIWSVQIKTISAA